MNSLPWMRQHSRMPLELLQVRLFRLDMPKSKTKTQQLHVSRVTNKQKLLTVKCSPVVDGIEPEMLLFLNILHQKRQANYTTYYNPSMPKTKRKSSNENPSSYRTVRFFISLINDSEELPLVMPLILPNAVIRL